MSQNELQIREQQEQCSHSLEKEQSQLSGEQDDEVAVAVQQGEGSAEAAGERSVPDLAAAELMNLVQSAAGEQAGEQVQQVLGSVRAALQSSANEQQPKKQWGEEEEGDSAPVSGSQIESGSSGGVLDPRVASDPDASGKGICEWSMIDKE